MRYRHVTFAVAFILGSLVEPVFAEPRAVIELFTSQGCSSCPAADKVLGELSRDPTLVTMSLAVDYWDYLGWKDTLALHGHSTRQRAYAEARGDREVYTPQVVVNGVVHVLGSDKAAIEKAIAQTRQDPETLALPVTMSVADGKLTVHVPDAQGEHHSGEVWLCPVTGTVSVHIGRGENHDRVLTYSNVVRRWMKLGDWSGKAATYTVPLSDIPKGDYTLSDVSRLDVVLQSGVAAKPGLMLGAASTVCCGEPSN
ncbi:MAG TPA: DUF1223 domain-containing protein [Pseudolabrys sp.]|nr:DUF1223 domain-containing protein [Pseudolabrys sp.]